ncbi:hypothetical protein SELMODRAFT_406185 [Selaginella moellendorffii]|uniref:Uncharacterized protein n=1 Tax=Selaginella moellendorffii TaxID=88036 RepID=D8R1J6_SELML|nr:hypothetical protein SELMODRAFT_406185 [Selaginella moellendorffii]
MRIGHPLLSVAKFLELEFSLFDISYPVHHHHHKDHYAKPPLLKSEQGERRIWQAKDEAGNCEILCSCCGRLKYAGVMKKRHHLQDLSAVVTGSSNKPFKCYTAPIQSLATPIALSLMTT